MAQVEEVQKCLLHVKLMAILVGVCLHVGYFQRGEHHMYALAYLQAFTLVAGALTFGISFFYGLPWTSTFKVVIPVFGYLFSGLYGSLLCYRLFYHPLRAFPGPVAAKLSSLWFSFHVRHFNAHTKSLELCNKYGPFVRVGSSDLMIAHPLGVPSVHGMKSKCRKAAWYDEDWPRQSIHTSRDPRFHAERRRLWSQSFSDKALRGYERRITVYNKALIGRLYEHGGQPINAAKYFTCYGFDVMGDLAFNKDFGMLKSGEQHFAVELLEEALGVQGLKLPTWIFRVLVAIPSLTKQYWKFIHYCDEQLDAKMADKNFDKPSLMNILLAHAGQRPSQQELLTLQSDCRTIIVAGSDTVAASLSFTFYLLAQHPKDVVKLREELKPFANDDGSFEHHKIERAVHLNAVIKEALRLYPVPPSAIVRQTPPEGISVGDTYIPGNINVWTPQYVIARSEAVYERPYDFLPERWITRVPGKHETAGYAPFLIGMNFCIRILS